MGDWKVDGPDGEKIESVPQMFGRFSGQVLAKTSDWQKRLHEQPEELEVIEREVRHEFTRGADLMVAALAAVVMASPELEASSEETRNHYGQPLAKGRPRSIRIQLLGGLIFWVTSLYCEPRKGVFRKKKDGARGVYIELEQFGFGKSISPGLESRVSRQAALCPSFELAQSELGRDGLNLDVKAVRRIAQQCGENLLRLRTFELQQWRNGELPATNELAGKRVTVQIDGGRTKLRGELRERTPVAEETDNDGVATSDTPGRSKKKAKRTFDGQWREPKLMTIFVHDDEGRMEKKSKATIDGTFTGPDAMAELVAMHLHRLGAAKAASLTFVSDGAVWIWDRVDAIVTQAEIPASVKINQVLDNCHAAHHVSTALAAWGLDQKERMPRYRELRTRLRNGRWRSVVEDLEDLAKDAPKNEELQTEINYLRKHGEAGRLSYPTFRGQGLPLGSGAIESSIRRVINLRLKSNATFWLAENAESTLQLRALVISDRWDNRMRSMRAFKRHTHLPDWHWQPGPMNSKSEREPNLAISP